MAGDNEDAKKTLASFVQGLGFNPINAGPLRSAAVLENLCVYWIQLAVKSGYGRNFVVNAVLSKSNAGAEMTPAVVIPWWMPGLPAKNSKP